MTLRDAVPVHPEEPLCGITKDKTGTAPQGERGGLE